MIQLTGFLQADRLRAVLTRCFADAPAPGDGAALKELINLNDVLARRWLRRLAAELFRAVHGCEPESAPFRTKGALKDFAVRCAAPGTPRVAALVQSYAERPAEFYRETPVVGRLYVRRDSDGAPVFLGSARLKRLRRIAEKGARRISDHVYRRLLETAQSTGRLPGVVPGGPDDDRLLATFEAAEAALGEELRAGRLDLSGWRFVINDVAGLKLVGDRAAQDAALAAIDAAPHLRLLEREEHRGAFRATNLTVAVHLDGWLDELCAEPLAPEDRAVLARRGIDPDTLPQRLRALAAGGGPPVVNAEIILSDFEEFVESELGRCMHEHRILVQRQHRLYRGPLARNVEYLLTWLFTFAISPQTRLEPLPIKVWGRYLVDAVEELLRQLWLPEADGLSF